MLALQKKINRQQGWRTIVWYFCFVCTLWFRRLSPLHWWSYRSSCSKHASCCNPNLPCNINHKRSSSPVVSIRLPLGCCNPNISNFNALSAMHWLACLQGSAAALSAMHASIISMIISAFGLALGSFSRQATTMSFTAWGHSSGTCQAINTSFEIEFR